MPLVDPPKRLSRRIDIGPFPASVRHLAFGALWSLLMGSLGLMAMSRIELACSRVDGASPSCTVRRSPPLPNVKRFPPGSVVRAEEIYRAGPKGNSPGSWDVVLVDERGRHTVVSTYADRQAAFAFGEQVRAFLNDSNRLAFHSRTEPGAKGWIILLIGLAGGIFMAVGGLARAGRLRVDVDRTHDAFRVRRTLFGIPRERSAYQNLERIVDMRLEYGPQPRSVFHRRGAPAERGVRIVLIRKDGLRRPLTSDFLPDSEAHANAIEALRAILELPPPEGAAAAAAPTARCVTPRFFATAWRSARPWIMGSAALTLVAVLAEASLLWYANRTQGWVEFHAQHRCMFDGMEMTPGAEMTMALDPGRYEIRVFNATVSGSWESQSFDVRVGQTTTVLCQPFQPR